MQSSSDFLEHLSKRHARLSILVIADRLPERFAEHKGRILFLGAEFPALPLQSCDFHFVNVESAEDIERQITMEAAHPRHAPFSIVFIDHDHRLDRVLRHIGAALTVASPDTLFLFDDSVPPRIGMTGPEATEDWWVGEVWMLPSILRPANEGFFCITADLPPTGLTAASGFALPPAAEIATIYETLSAVRTDAALRYFVNPSDPKHMFTKADMTLGVISIPNAIRIDPGGEADDALFSRRIVAPPDTWMKPPPFFYADLSTRGHNLTRLMQAERKAAGKYIDTFQETHLIGFNGLVKDGKYFDHWLNTDDADLSELASQTNRYANRWTGLILMNEVPVLPLERLETARRIDEPVMFGTPDEPDNWGMWLLLALPSMWEFLQNRDRYQKFIGAAQHGWQAKLIAAAGITDEDLIPHDREQAYFCREISIIRRSYRDLIITDDERQNFQSFCKKLVPEARPHASRRIFVSRITRSKRSGNYRGLINEDELIAGLEPLGFAIVEPEYLSFAEQVAIFSAADIVVGLGGAGMFNVVFCKPEAIIVTIESGMAFLDAHTNIFGSLGLAYGVILGEEDMTDPRPNQRRWRLDVAGAIEQIKRILN